MSEKRQIRILHLEDNPQDAFLILDQLRTSGYDVDCCQVTSKADYVRELAHEWDLVLSDYRLPGFDGIQALTLLQATGRVIPFIVVSGTIGEETATELMRLGATDYVLKDRLGRLGAAIQNALERSSDKREREKSAAESKMFRSLIDQSDDTFEVIDPDTAQFLDVTQKGADEIGYTKEEYLSRTVFDINPEFSRADWAPFIAEIRSKGSMRGESIHQRKDGSIFPIEWSARWVEFDRNYIVTSIRDISERKKAESDLVAGEKRFRTTLENLREGCLIVSHDWRYLYVNKIAAQLVQKSVEQLIDQKIFEVDPELKGTDVHATLLQCMADRTSREIEHESRRGERSTWYHLVVQPIPEGLFILSLDITERKLAERKMQLQVDELRRWQSLTLGREERVIALKHEVNELLQQLGHPSRYSEKT